MYSKSSQKRNWTFDATELINLRVKNNQEYITTHGSEMDVRKIKFFNQKFN